MARHLAQKLRIPAPSLLMGNMTNIINLSEMHNNAKIETSDSIFSGHPKNPFLLNSMRHIGRLWQSLLVEPLVIANICDEISMPTKKHTYHASFATFPLSRFRLFFITVASIAFVYSDLYSRLMRC